MSNGREVSRSSKTGAHPFRRAVLRGLAVVMPPLLTIVLFIWAWATIDSYVLKPCESLASWVILSGMEEIKDSIPEDTPPENIRVTVAGNDILLNQMFETLPPRDQLARRVQAKGGEINSFLSSSGQVFVPLKNGKWIPEKVLAEVAADPGDLKLETATGHEIYERYLRLTWLRRTKVIPTFLVLFIGFLYLLGKFLAAGAGRIIWNSVESLINRVPIIRNVYSSVKQVTDFLFSEREIQYTRIVAVEYPRKGIWSVGFVTGESLLDIRSAANEPVLAVLIPTSPMPATGFTVTVAKSETVDLNITMDQAIQFIVSCGVVVPPQQQEGGELIGEVIQKLVPGKSGDNGSGRPAAIKPIESADASGESEPD